MNNIELFQKEAPEVAGAFNELIQSIHHIKVLDPKIKQLIYIAIKASQGETNAVLAHVPMAKKCGATRDELKEAILITTTVCGFKGISVLGEALDCYDKLS